MILSQAISFKLVFQFLLFIACIEASEFSITLNIDSEALLLEFATSDNFRELANQWAIRHSLDRMQSGCTMHPVPFTCVVDKVVDAMNLQVSVDIAQRARLGLQTFDVSRKRQQSLIVVDNFLEEPFGLREFALSSEFRYKGNHPGMRTVSFANHAVFRPIRRQVEELIGEKLPYWFASFQKSFARDMDNGVHRDSPAYKYSAVVYLSPPDSPLTFGTSTWRHKATGLYGQPTPEDGRKRNRTVEHLLDALIDDPGQEEYDEVDRIGSRFNRLVIFNSLLNHRSSQLGGLGRDNDDARLVLIMFFNTEDPIGQEGSILYYDDDPGR